MRRATPATDRAAASPLVERPHLERSLERAAGRALTLVVAPAGTGKTVLVREWLSKSRRENGSAWVSVERGERDPQRFWNSVINALHHVAPTAVTADAPRPAPGYDGKATVERLARELESLEQPIVLVIDDLHEIADDGILRELRYLISRIPPALHVVLLSRRDQPLGVHIYRLEGQLSEIRGDQLRLTLAETEQMLLAGDVVLSRESIELLHARTEGWVAGLRLAQLSLTGHPDPDRFIADFSGSERSVAEYLLAEVLGTQAPDIRRLLLRASLLERVNGELGDLLTGENGSERHLRSLAEVGVFVLHEDPGRTWFRFHRMFAELLAHELRQTEPGELSRLHRQASDWYAENGHPIEAIVHAHAAGDQPNAEKLLIRHYFSLVLDGRLATAHALVLEHGVGRIEDSPELAAVLASDELNAGSLEQAEAFLALAEKHAQLVPAERRHRFGMALRITRISLARRRGDLESVLEEAGLEQIEPRLYERTDVEMYSDVRALLLMNVGAVEVWSGRLADGEAHLEAARELAKEIGRPYIAVYCGAQLAHAISWRSFSAATEEARRTLALAERNGWGSDAVIAALLVTLGLAHLQAGRLDEGELWLARADEVMNSQLEPAIGLLLHLTTALLQVARGQYADALESCREGERLGLRLAKDSPLAAQLKGSKLYAMTRAGQVEAVEEELAQMSEGERSRGTIREVIAAVALAQGSPQRAIETLAPTLAGEAEIHHVAVLIRSLLLDARARELLDQPNAAERSIERALELAEPERLVLPFIYTASQRQLERHAGNRTAHSGFLREIHDTLSGHFAPREAASDASTEDLTEAEMRVLRFLPTNLPVASIAAELYLSSNTVKTHMRRIYAKLDAHTRAEAVEEARRLGLLRRSSLRD